MPSSSTVSSSSRSDWKGKNVVVCGATAGLGRELATKLAEQNPKSLMLMARRPEPLESFAAELSSGFPSTQTIPLSVDVCDGDSLKRHLEANSPIPPDLVINAVGESDRGSILDLQTEKLNDLLRVNVHSSLNVIQSFHPRLAAAKGTLVLIGSLASLFAPRFLGGYAIAKHGVAALAQQTRLELGEDDVHVMLACPGPIKRDDAGKRYNQLKPQDGSQTAIPEEALQPGGGAQVKGLDPSTLASDILIAAAKKKKILIRPRKAWLLHALYAISPALGEKILRNKTA